MTMRAAFSLLSLVTVMTLAGCGLSPVYGTYANTGQNAGVAASLNTVSIDTIPDRTGQKLRNLLVDRFYSTGAPTAHNAVYRLYVAPVTESIYGLGIAKDATATRSQVRLTSYFTLTRTDDLEQESLIHRNLTAISSFNTLASQYTTLITEEDARDQAIREMAQQITTLLELYFTDPARFPAPADVPLSASAIRDAERELRRQGETPEDARAQVQKDMQNNRR